MARTTVSRSWIHDSLTDILKGAGVDASSAATVAELLAEAEARGASSHGALLIPMYVGRLLAGSVTTGSEGEVVEDRGAVAVIDAKNILGQLSSIQAMDLAIEKAERYGVGVVTVRNAFHFGQAGPYTERATARGMIGIAAANTRPLMPAVGGAKTVIGNNPIGLGVPAGKGEDAAFVVDMALSEVSLGKIRLAEADGREIPDTWATDAQGRPTTDPKAAIEGMLLPTGGVKGFALALFIDVITGILSFGGFGSKVQGLYKDFSAPNNSGHFFLAINPAFFGDADVFASNVKILAEEVLDSPTAPGVDSVRLPGHGSRGKAQKSVDEGIVLSDAVLKQMQATASELGVELTIPEEADHAGHI